MVSFEDKGESVVGKGKIVDFSRFQKEYRFLGILSVVRFIGIDFQKENLYYFKLLNL